jgi:hypothetical protein
MGPTNPAKWTSWTRKTQGGSGRPIWPASESDLVGIERYAPRVSNEVRFATPYLQVETQSTALERAFERELAGAMLVAMTMERTGGDLPQEPFRPAL